MTTLTQSALILSLIATVAACAPETNAKLSDNADTQPASLNDPAFFLAMMNQASPKDPAAFRLVAFTTKNVDPKSVQYCFDTAVNCAAGQGAKLPGLAQTVSGGRKVFLSQQFVRIVDNLNVTIIGQDSAGQALTAGFKFVSKGSVPTDQNANDNATPPSPSNPPPGTASLSETNPPPALQSDCYKAPNDFICQAEKECVRLTNEKRASEALTILKFNKEMGYISRLWSVAQAEGGAISHDWFNAGTWKSKFETEFKQPSPALAENVAMNGGLDDSKPTFLASALVEQWWASPGHRANMVGAYTIMSCGFAKGQDGWYGTQNFGN